MIILKFAQVLTSLAFLHSLGLIHSDLKPENILIKSYSRYDRPWPGSQCKSSLLMLQPNAAAKGDWTGPSIVVE